MFFHKYKVVTFDSNGKKMLNFSEVYPMKKHICVKMCWIVLWKMLMKHNNMCIHR